MAFYPAIPASDGTSMEARENSEFQVFELYDTTRSTPLPLLSTAGTNAAPLVTTAQGVVPPVEVVSPNVSHIFKSGAWEWRRDSFDGVEVAVKEARNAAGVAASAAMQVQLKAEAGEFKGATGPEGSPGPQGLPGVNAVPAVQAVADYIRTPGNAVSEALSVAVEAGTQQPRLAQLFIPLMERDTRAVVIAGAGSSTMAGSAATSADNRWFNTLARRIQAAYPPPEGVENPATVMLAAAVSKPPTTPGIHFVNSGVGGSTAANYLTATTGPQLAALGPDVIFHMVGSNDRHSGRTVQAYITDIRNRLDQLDADSTRPILHILMHQYRRATWVGLTDWATWGHGLRALASSRPNAVFLDLSQHYEAVGVPPGADTYKLISSDLIHQTNKGHAFMADLVARMLGIPEPQMRLASTPPTTPPVTPPPADEPTVTKFTSDTFVGDGPLLGRTSDAALGGVPKTYAGASGFATAGGRLISEPGTASISFCGIDLPAGADVQVSVECVNYPTADNVFLDLFRGAGGVSQNGYRIEYRADGAPRLIKRLAGVTSTLFDIDNGDRNKRLTLRKYRGVLSLRVDDREVWAAASEASVPQEGGVGFARGKTTSAGFAFDQLAVDILTQSSTK